MKEKVTIFLNRPLVKIILLSGSTLVIGGICSALGSWDYINDSSFVKKVIALLIACIIYLILLAYYTKNETNEKNVSNIYLAQNEAFSVLMVGLITVCKKSAEGANKVIKSIIKNKTANLELWDFNQACFMVCKNIYDLLCKIGSGKDFEVIYIRLDETTKPEEYIYANAYANRNMKPPSLYGEKRCITEDEYHDVELFKKNEADYEIIMGYDNIDHVFDYRSKDKRNKNKGKYNQYVAIPVFCNDKKMIGLLEIVCFDKTFLSKSEEEIREIVSKYLVPYTFVILLLHKLEKALIAQPDEKVIG